MRFHFVVNPVAGRRRAFALTEAIVPRLRAAGHEATAHVTTGPGDARAHVAALRASACDRLVVAGGDGTIREVVNAKERIPWPVGVLPVGTANLVSREVALPLPRRPEPLAAGLVAAGPWEVGLLEISRPGGGTERAVATVGAGLDAEIVHRVGEVRRAAGGAGGYRKWVRPLWRTLTGFEMPVLEVTVDGRRTWYGSAAIVQNARSYGGVFCLTPAARIDADRFHVVVVRSWARRDLVRVLAGALRGGVSRWHDVTVATGTTARVRCLSSVAVQADGDPAGTTDLAVRLLPRALTLLRAPAG